MRLAHLSCTADPPGAFKAVIGKTEFVIRSEQMFPSEELLRVNALRGFSTETLVSLSLDSATGKVRCGRPY